MSIQYKNNAYHEAGHAVVAHLVGLDCVQVAIQVRNGYCAFIEPPDLYLRLRSRDQGATSWAKAKAVMLAGGVEAESVLLRARHIVGNQDDRGQIASLLADINPAPEIDAPSHEWSLWQRKDQEMRRRIRRRARRLVVFASAAISTLAEHLMEKRTIVGSEVIELIEPLLPAHQDWSMVGWLDCSSGILHQGSVAQRIS
ncbi:MAG: hypothetical protein ABIY70_09750 [Capsulimonas sp.]|uniref:hypothetical protein n=1 Tax=Capsulimonas sp. TaxID=2494211 RepID=UPI003266E9BC